MPTKRKKQRKKRCDVGSHKRSLAVKLSGLRLEFSEERDLLEGRLLTSDLNAAATCDNIPTWGQVDISDNVLETELWFKYLPMIVTSWNKKIN